MLSLNNFRQEWKYVYTDEPPSKRLTDDSHEKSSHSFSEKKIKMLSAEVMISALKFQQ